MTTRTARGFSCYANLTDDYAAIVQVTESSAAQIEGVPGGPWVWIMIEGGAITANKGSSHLNPDQARRVRDALTAWLEDIEERTEDGRR